MSEAKIAEIQARREQRKAELEAQRLAQRAKDLEAVDALEEQHGMGRVVVSDLEFYTPGLPTLVAMLVPNRNQFKRYQDMCAEKKPTAAALAAELIGDSCLCYPDKDTHQRVRDAHPGIHVVAATAAIQASAGHREAEGKE